MDAVAGPGQRRNAATVRAAIALLDRIDDARALGIVPDGAAARILEAEPQLEAFLRQSDRPAAAVATLAALAELADTLEGPIWT